MIIIILFGVLLLVSILFIFISKINYWDDKEFIGWAGTALFGLALFICGLISLLNNASSQCYKAKAWYEQQVTQLNNTYETLTTHAYNPIAIQQYNSEVAEFKGKIIAAQLSLNNPWISWFECKEYKNMSAEAVKYVTY